MEEAQEEPQEVAEEEVQGKEEVGLVKEDEEEREVVEEEKA